jgi:hypothetical protein
MLRKCYTTLGSWFVSVGQIEKVALPRRWPSSRVLLGSKLRVLNATVLRLARVTYKGQLLRFEAKENKRSNAPGKVGRERQQEFTVERVPARAGLFRITEGVMGNCVEDM